MKRLLKLKNFLILISLMVIMLHWLCIPGLAASSDSLISRCRDALQMDMDSSKARESVIFLVEEIKNKENLYLKSALFPDIRLYYEKLVVRLGDYYFAKKDYKKALDCYTEADKYSIAGYRSKITASHKAIDNLTEFPVKTTADDDKYYSEICTKGLEGYMRFRQTYFGNIKKDFWQYFDNLTRNLYDKKEYEKILECSEFWSHLREDEFFASDEDARADKKSIDSIFSRVQEDYKNSIKEKMASLQPIDTASGYTLEKIAKYTGDKGFARDVESYYAAYKSLQMLIFPGNYDNVSEMKSLLQKMNQYCDLNKEIRYMMSDYISQWDSYFQVKEGQTYAQKSYASRDRRKKLINIRMIARDLNGFGINPNLSKIDKKIQEAEYEEKKWDIHHQVDITISKFENNKYSTVDDLYDTADRVSRLTGDIPLESLLDERVQLFRRIPGKGDLSINSLEDYLDHMRRRDNIVVKVLKNEFKKKLIAKVDTDLNAGGSSLKDLWEISETAAKYERYFEESVPRDQCILLLIKYHTAIRDDDYPSLLELYEATPSISISCKDLLDKWRVLSKQKILEKYSKYYGNLADKVLGDKGGKTELDFTNFKKVCKHARQYFPLSEEWIDRYLMLNAYFDAPGIDYQERAAKDLYKRFPKLAESYSLPGPY
jgi:hypothetical protein